MTGTELYAALAGMTPRQRDLCRVVVKLNDGSRPTPLIEVTSTGILHRNFWLEISL